MDCLAVHLAALCSDPNSRTDSNTLPSPTTRGSCRSRTTRERAGSRRRWRRPARRAPRWTCGTTPRWPGRSATAGSARVDLRYNATVAGEISYGRISAVSRISAQDLFLWFAVRSIRVDVPSSGVIYFDVGVVFKHFPLSVFEAAPPCLPNELILLNPQQQNEGPRETASWSPPRQRLPTPRDCAWRPIFETHKATVRVARIEFDLSELTDSNDDGVDAALNELTRPEAGNDAFPAASPCGQWVVFRSGRSGQKNLYIVDAARGEDTIRRLTDGEWIDTMPSWSPDGSLIAFSSNRHDAANPAVFSIYLVRPDGTGLRRVHVAGPPGSAEADKERINHVCFSPDCRWLLFTANLGAVNAKPVSGPNMFQPYGDLYVCRLDGSRLLRLTCNA